jgi:alanine dehydrogenase
VIIGVPREVKDHETRVGLVPSGVASLVEAGHRVLVETQAGTGSSIPDSVYKRVGAEIVPGADAAWSAELVVKVKEPQQREWTYLRPGLLVFTYLHLAPLPELTSALLEKRVSAIAYETLREADGSLPLLIPMSEVAGRMSVQVGAQYLEKPNGGRGILLGGIPSVAPANVVILGGGLVGLNAAKMACGLGAHVSVADRNLNRLRQLDDMFHGGIVTLASNDWTVRESIRLADLVIGAALVPGASAPRLVRREWLADMRKGSVLVDVAIDQGGCFETSRPTTHSDPVYVVDHIIHYCVSNMPAAVPHTSTLGLTNATIPYVIEIANKGLAGACEARPAIVEGVNTYGGHITCRAVAESQGREHRDLKSLL